MSKKATSLVTPRGLTAQPPEGLVKAQLLARDVAEAAESAAWAGMTERDLARWAEEALRAGVRPDCGPWSTSGSAQAA